MRKTICFIKLMGLSLGLLLLLTTPIQVKSAEKTDILISGLYDLTGPYAGVHQLFAKVAKDYVKWSNDQELVPGANIVLDIVDTGNEISKTVVAFQMAANKTPKAVLSTGGFSSSTVPACKPLAERLRIPIIAGSSPRNIVLPPGWVFSVQGCYEGMTAAFGDWIKANWKPDSSDPWIRAHYENRKPRLGIIGWDNAFGRAFDQKEFRDYLENIGVDFAGSAYIPLSPSDTTPQILRIVKDENADFVYFGMYPESIGVVLKDASRLGLLDDFQACTFWASGLVQLQSYIKELANRSMCLTGYKMMENEWEIPYFVKAFKESNLPPIFGMYYSGAAAYFDVYIEAIRRAAVKVGPNKVDGQEVYNALINMKNYQPRLYHSKCSFSETKRVGPDTAVIYQIQDGKQVLLEKDVYVPDILPGGKDVVK